MIDVDVNIDPMEVDKLLVSELNQLSMLHRERANEEIHGIVDSSITDTTNNHNNDVTKKQEEEEQALLNLQKELDTIYDVDTHSRSTTTLLYPAYYYARSHGSGLITDRGFCLSFLAQEGYSHPQRAALRLLRYLEHIQRIYQTNQVLFRPIRLSDLEQKGEEEEDTTNNNNNSVISVIGPLSPSISVAEYSAAESTKTSTTTTKQQLATTTTKATIVVQKQEHNTENKDDDMDKEEEVEVEVSTSISMSTTTTSTSASNLLFTAKRLLYEEGFLQVLPVRDSVGRRIFVHLREPSAPYSIPARQGVGHYMSQSIAEEPSGVIFIVFLHCVDTTMKNKEELKSIQEMFQTNRTKFSAIHFCCPRGAIFNAVRATYTLLVGKQNRTRLRFHMGSYQECKYSLNTFGIPVERLPENVFCHKTQNVIKRENHNHRRWIAMQEALEEEIEHEVVTMTSTSTSTSLLTSTSTVLPSLQKLNLSTSTSNDNDNDNDEMSNHSNNNNINHNMSVISAIEMEAHHHVRSKYIECAYHEDCLFGKGRPAMRHPGNIAMRRLLEEKYVLYNQEWEEERKKKQQQQQQQQQEQQQQQQQQKHNTDKNNSSSGTIMKKKKRNTITNDMKTKIGLEIVRDIKQGAGRFLKEVDGPGNGDGSGLLVVVDHKCALQKIKIALRDLKKRKEKELLLVSSLSTSTHPEKEGEQATPTTTPTTTTMRGRRQQPVTKKKKTRTARGSKRRIFIPSTIRLRSLSPITSSQQTSSSVGTVSTAATTTTTTTDNDTIDDYLLHDPQFTTTGGTTTHLQPYERRRKSQKINNKDSPQTSDDDDHHHHHHHVGRVFLETHVLPIDIDVVTNEQHIGEDVFCWTGIEEYIPCDNISSNNNDNDNDNDDTVPSIAAATTTMFEIDIIPNQIHSGRI